MCANLSIATFSRQKPSGANEVELCVKGVSNPGGSMIRAISSSSMLLALTSTSRNVDCANMKKLAWLVRLSFKMHRESSDENNMRTLAGCVTCTKMSLRGIIGNSRKCHVCWEYVCSSCKIKKKLSQTRDNVDGKHGEFLSCYLKVIHGQSLDNERAVAMMALIVKHTKGNKQFYMVQGIAAAHTRARAHLNTGSGLCVVRWWSALLLHQELFDTVFKVAQELVSGYCHWHPLTGSTLRLLSLHQAGFGRV